jgi:phosphoserine aminotransferase
MLEWILEMGGVGAVGRENEKKAKAMYDFIDNSRLYSNDVEAAYRSLVNIKFFLKQPELEINFLSGAEERGLFNLKGHPSIGGIRASLYNSMPMEGVLRLLDWMFLFEKECLL